MSYPTAELLWRMERRRRFSVEKKLARRKKRIPLDDCIDAIANFCDCRVWREKGQSGNPRYVFFGLPSDMEVAHYLTELIDNAVRSELGRYKSSAGYQGFRHQHRHLANSSFTLGMVVSIADKLSAMKRERDAVKNGSGRDLVFLKGSVVDAEPGRHGQHPAGYDALARRRARSFVLASGAVGSGRAGSRRRLGHTRQRL